jgi:hypothetical protein
MSLASNAAIVAQDPVRSRSVQVTFIRCIDSTDQRG